MNETIYLQPGFILKYRNYRETSIILEVFTRDYGKINLLAKGVRKPKSKTAGLLQPFLPLLISFTGKTELKALIHVEFLNMKISHLAGVALYCGFYVNELTGHFLHVYDPNPDVFNDYFKCLQALSEAGQQEIALRQYELNLLENLGYGVQLGFDPSLQKPVEANKHYEFYVEQGPIETTNGQFSGQILLAIDNREFAEIKVRSAAKIIMRRVIDFYLQGKPLKSRSVINKIIKL
ncbi:MAG: DNA repair protein RecO [Methylobacter sp.]|nr:MAG: DNA repair protein RecO [Methylobacter sp.]PPD24311.1 MAG: DNA repair protein RecO [Methylobacter sp.]PPD35446.1 MAG: DNA repair protein RecO [Methylomonas sp.]